MGYRILVTYHEGNDTWEAEYQHENVLGHWVTSTSALQKTPGDAVAEVLDMENRVHSLPEKRHKYEGWTDSEKLTRIIELLEILERGG